jgi:amino acid transporter
LALGASTVAVGWSTYFADVMKEAGITIPGFAYGEGHNLVAAAIVLILTAVICAGIKISSQVNFVFVVIKLSIVLLVIGAGVFFIKSGNYSPSSHLPARRLPRVPRPLRRCCRTWGSRPARSGSAGSSWEGPWCSSPT